MKLKFDHRELQKIYDTTLDSWKYQTLSGIEPHLQLIAQTLLALEGIKSIKIELPNRQNYQSVDDE